MCSFPPSHGSFAVMNPLRRASLLGVAKGGREGKKEYRKKTYGNTSDGSTEQKHKARVDVALSVAGDAVM